MDDEQALDATIASYFGLLTPEHEAFSTFEQLSTGVTLAEVLLQVDGIQFDRNRVSTEGGWTTSLNNLKLLVRELEEFHR